jgi:hypothetical protein
LNVDEELGGSLRGCVVVVLIEGVADFVVGEVGDLAVEIVADCVVDFVDFDGFGVDF